MSNIRSRGIPYVENKLGKEIGPEHTAVSKYYIASESWTKTPAWWFDIPLNKLKENPYIHLICELENREDFAYFLVPTKFLNDKIKTLEPQIQKEICQRRILRLHLSASSENLFQDLRDLNGVEFACFQIF